MDRILHALADPSRRVMVERLSNGPASVSELARPLPMSHRGLGASGVAGSMVLG
jgi:DNA-binding transcriptional ArsR family regulator